MARTGNRQPSSAPLGCIELQQHIPRRLTKQIAAEQAVSLPAQAQDVVRHSIELGIISAVRPGAAKCAVKACVQFTKLTKQVIDIIIRVVIAAQGRTETFSDRNMLHYALPFDYMGG